MAIYDSDLLTHTKRSSWTNTIKNSVEYEYYTAVDSEKNPSGNKNMKRIVHKDGYGAIVFVVNFEFDSDDDIVKEYSTKE